MTGGHGSTLYVVATPSGTDPGQKTYRVYDTSGPVPEELAAFDALAREVKPRPLPDQPPAPAATTRGTNGLPARPYDRLFGEHPGRFQESDLEILGSAMIRPDGADEVSAVPAGYTYLGQLIFHDITWMDPDAPSLNQVSSQLDFKSITEKAEPDTSASGDGPLAIGSTLPYPYPAMRQDLPRVRAGADVGRPLIADARNDSFLPLSQMHLLFLMFFNAVARHCGYGTDGYDEKRAMRLYILHAQHAVIEDYLSLIIDPAVYADVIKNGRRFVSPGAAGLRDFDVSIEFAAAIGRFGHAMIRSEYVPWNSARQTANLFFFTRYSYRNREQDRPMYAIDSDWVTSWHHLFAFPGRPTGALPLRAACIGPKLPNPLGKLPERIRHTGDGEPPNTDFNLAQVTLKRQRSLDLAPAETAIGIVNRRLGRDAIVPLSADRLAERLPPEAAALFAEGGGLRDRTPLWFYTLREAELLGGGDRLGPFGSRVTMETLHACIEKSDISILKEPGWRPELRCHEPGRFTITDLISFATNPDPLKRWTG